MFDSIWGCNSYTELARDFLKKIKEIALYRVGCELLECDSTAACGSR